MIDIESDVYSAVASVLREKFPGVFTSGEFIDTPARFPAVTIMESDNSVYQPMRTTRIENAASVMYEISVFTNSVGYKKSEARDIMEAADGEMERLGFTRISMNPVSNLQDATIYRLVARYQAVVDRDLWIYQN